MNKDITIEGLDDLFITLDKLSLKGVAMQPIMAQIGQYIQNATEESFERQKSPFGEAWMPSKDKTPKKQTLVDKGILRSSFTVDAGESEVSVGTNVVYAAIHQFGGKAGRNRGVKIPARPFMPMDSGGHMPSGLVDEIMEYLGDQLMDK